MTHRQQGQRPVRFRSLRQDSACARSCAAPARSVASRAPNADHLAVARIDVAAVWCSVGVVPTTAHQSGL